MKYLHLQSNFQNPELSITIYITSSPEQNPEECKNGAVYSTPKHHPNHVITYKVETLMNRCLFHIEDPLKRSLL